MGKRTVYVVIARRWGDPESHAYLVGVYEKKHAALEAAEKEADWRGGKYGCEVIAAPVEPEWSDNDGKAYIKRAELRFGAKP